MIVVREITLPLEGFATMAAESATEGYGFLVRLRAEWESGENRFAGPGEVLLGVFDDEELVGIGGLNRDPFAGDDSIGRLRRIYVREAWRGRGAGSALVEALLARARLHFKIVRLRAIGERAGKLYERYGFTPTPDKSATHALTLEGFAEDPLR